MAEEAMEHFRAVCARTRDTVARNAKFNGSVERLFDVERRLGGNAVAALDVSTLADLGEAAERALHALGDWRAASVTNRMKGHDADVESALAELCARGVEVAAEAERVPRGETSDIVVPAIPAVPERDAVVSTSSSTDPPPFPPTIPTPMRRHPPASAAAAAHARDLAVPEIIGAARHSPRRPRQVRIEHRTPPYSECGRFPAHAHRARAHSARLRSSCSSACRGERARRSAPRSARTGTGRSSARRVVAHRLHVVRVASLAAGDADAMNALGSMLLRDDEKATGEARDREAAVRLFAEAGARGCAAADYNLAACLEAGAATPRRRGKKPNLCSAARFLWACSARTCRSGTWRCATTRTSAPPPGTSPRFPGTSPGTSRRSASRLWGSARGTSRRRRFAWRT